MVGSAVGPYQIISKLGTGGMGEVFLGHDPRLQRRVALKRLTAAENPSGDVHARVLREARAAARLNHPHIATVYDVLEQDGRAYIVMEYVDGESLLAKLARGPVPIDQVRDIGRQLASALAAAHAQGVIHRDLKPANIQVTPAGTIKLLDLGVAKLIVVRPHDTDAGTHGHPLEATLAGNPGTPIYMSPEQLFGHEIDGRSDVYSAGVVLFEMATGRRPFQENGAVALAFAMKSQPPAAAHTVNPGVPRELSNTIAKALEGDPARRFQSARELGLALTAASTTVMPAVVASSSRESPGLPESPGASAVTPSAPPQDSRSSWWTRGWTAVAAVAVLLAVGTVAREPLMERLRLLSGAPAVVTPIGIALLPIDNPTGDSQAEHFGNQIASTLAANLGSLPGLKVVSRASTVEFATSRSDVAAIGAHLDAKYVLDITIKSAAPQAEVVARMRRADRAAAPPLWQETFTGSPIDVEKSLLEHAAQTLARDGLWAHALSTEDWTRIRRLPTTSREALMAYVEARALLDRNDIAANVEGAINRLQDAVKSDPSFALGYATLGTALLTRYDKARDSALVDRASAAVSTALRLSPDLSAAHAAFGLLQSATALRDAAIASYRRAIDLDASNDEAHRLLGRVLAAQGRVDDAVRELREAVRLRPQSFENHYRLGNALYNGGRYQEAVDAYRRATEIQPMRGDAYTNLGVAYHMLGDIDQAIGNYEHAIRVGGDDALGYGNLALAYFFAERYDDSRKTYIEAIGRDPKRASLHRDLGDVYTKIGRTVDAAREYTTAIALARQSLAVDPRDALAIVLIARCQAGLGHRGEAERAAAEAVTLAPTDRDVLFRAAKTYAVVGNQTAAFDKLAAAIQRGYSPQLARDDPELAPIRRQSGFEQAIDAGLRARGGGRQ